MHFHSACGWQGILVITWWYKRLQLFFGSAGCVVEDELQGRHPGGVADRVKSSLHMFQAGFYLSAEAGLFLVEMLKVAGSNKTQIRKDRMCKITHALLF